MKIRSTTILAVRREGIVAMGSDGQVTVGSTVLKSNARKLRRIHHDTILADLRARRPMRSLCLKNLNPSWRNTVAI